MATSDRQGARDDAHADGRWREYVVATRRRTRALRDLQGALLQLATHLDAEPRDRGVLLLVEPGISDERLRYEWSSTLRLLRDDIRERLRLVTQRDGDLQGLPPNADPALSRFLAASATPGTRDGDGVRLKRPSAESQVLELLVRHWMLGEGPVTTKSLEDDSGFSYPAVAAVLDRLAPALRRTSDRRVELATFPRDDWARLVADAARTRSTSWFVDRSGRPRSPEALRSRIRELERADLAEGGTDGARHYVSDLDVVGSPWVSLEMHCPRRRADFGFVRRLDPALELRRRRPDESPSLVIHCVQRPSTGFHRGHDGALWASPVDCLLDLHEMRLEAQARDFVAHFAAQRMDHPS